MANEKQQPPQTTASLATSIIPEFHAASDDWNVYREILEEFYRANGITGAGRVPVLLSVIGKGTYRTVRGLCHPRSPKEMEYDELCRVMARQFVPEVAIFRLRSRFYRAEQRRCGGESVKQWYARLKALSVECQFEEQQLEPLLLDRFVIGLAPGPVQNRLCEELPGSLTLERAVDIAASVEAAQHPTTDDAEEMVQEFAEMGLGEADGEGERHCSRRRHRHRGRHGRHARFGLLGHGVMGPWGPFAGPFAGGHGSHHRHRHQHPHAPAPGWQSGAEEMAPHRHHHRHHHRHPAAPHWGPPAGVFMPGGFGRPCHRERPSRGYGGPGMMCPGSSYERRLAKKWRKMHYRMRRSRSTSSSSSSSSSSNSSSSSGSSSSSSTSGSASETEREPQTTDKKCRKRDKNEAAAQRKHHHGKHGHGHGRHEHGHGHGRRRRGHGHGHGHGHHHHHGFDAGSRRHQHRSRRQQATAEETQPINNEPTTEPELIE
uniref:Uncharacterized protein n=1 Tax=Anopheles marajoara TaxID=58244 RepID=A0A2M4BLJ0_9DIPT